MKHYIRQIACVTLLAFIFNAILPFFAVYDTANHQAIAKKSSALFGEKILICTGDGFKWVKLGDLQSGKEKHDPPSYQCAVCYLAAHGLKDIVTPDAIVLSDVAGSHTHYANVDTAAALKLASSFHSRAPPEFLL